MTASVNYWFSANVTAMIDLMNKEASTAHHGDLF
jgi:hypothetical protein